jgi:hypothetical protein
MFLHKSTLLLQNKCKYVSQPRLHGDTANDANQKFPWRHQGFHHPTKFCQKHMATLALTPLLGNGDTNNTAIYKGQKQCCQCTDGDSGVVAFNIDMATLTIPPCDSMKKNICLSFSHALLLLVQIYYKFYFKL